MLFIGSVCAIITSVFMYCKHRESWILAMQLFLDEVKYGILGFKEALNDWMNAKYNKNGKFNQCIYLFFAVLLIIIKFKISVARNF